MRVSPLLRTLVSYLPSRSVLGLRRLSDLPRSIVGRPHDADYEVFRGYIPVCPNVVDVGGNRGQTIVSLRRVLRRPRIWSFEPNPDLARYLSRRFSSQDVVVFSFGLSATTQKRTLFLPRYGHTVWDTRASLAESEARRHLNPNQFWHYNEARVAVEKIQVEVRTLDEFKLAPDILKIDVEGAEASVVQGGLATIQSHSPVILVEGDAADTERLLGDYGYRIHRFDPEGRRFVVGESGSLNTFLLRRDHYSRFADVQIFEAF